MIADVVGSTKAIGDGDYKKVNTVGVACIAAVVNVDRSIDIPFVFGGDGATFAVPDVLVQRVIAALRGSQELSRLSFGLDLRAGLVKVGDLAEQDFRVDIAKVRLSPHMTQSAFSGRGWSEAERRVKAPAAAGVLMVREAEGPAVANFDGFECRWQGVPSFNGHKLSLLVAAMSDDPGVNLDTYQALSGKIREIYGEVVNYHPLRPGRMRLTFNPRSLRHEWRVRSRHSGWRQAIGYLMKMLLQNLAGAYLIARRVDTESVQWSHYREELVDNSDFCKFDGMLRMVIDGNDAQAEELEQYLKSQCRAGRLVYGMHKSREALVTCLVQSYSGNHLHFVDGSDGGYTLAARGLKQQLESFRDARNTARDLRFPSQSKRPAARKAIEIEIDHRRDEQRDHLREQQAADHREAQRLAQFGTRAQAHGDGQRAHQRRRGGHHDRAETQQAGGADRFVRRHAAVALRIEREVDHHDGVFLDDADQHQDADHGDDRKIHVEQPQHRQRADRSRGQAGQNGERVDIAFIQHAQQHIDHQQRGGDQHDLAGLRRLECRRVAAVAGEYAHRHIELALELLDAPGGIAQRRAGREIEGDRHRRRAGRRD